MLIKIPVHLIEQLSCQSYAHLLREITPPWFFVKFQCFGIKTSDRISLLFRCLIVASDRNWSDCREGGYFYNCWYTSPDFFPLNAYRKSVFKKKDPSFEGITGYPHLSGKLGDRHIWDFVLPVRHNCQDSRIPVDFSTQETAGRWDQAPSAAFFAAAQTKL